MYFLLKCPKQLNSLKQVIESFISKIFYLFSDRVKGGSCLIIDQYRGSLQHSSCYGNTLFFTT